MNDRVRLAGISIDSLTMEQAVQQLLAWVRQPDAGCRYVVTPNVDHAVLFQRNAALRAAYDGAALVLADGMPLVWTSRLLGHALPERVTGSDLVPAVFAAVPEEQRLRVFLLGAAAGVGERAAANIARRWPAVEVVGTYSPPLGFEHDGVENEAILQRVAAARPDVLVVGLGAPKQELWVHKYRGQIAAPIALCVGATIDFLAENVSRAPVWMRTSGLEWLHRLASQPRRLAARYARDAWIFPQLVLRDLLAARGQSARTVN
ncbi:MAG TPA: WecB/TagA/CpsF family glycosyltransferase [Pirellulales bacterium]|nr:WecB/TagA/CpsF family glycosyltransferase [Pirellulales bacterium]